MRESPAATGYMVDQKPELAELPDVPLPGATEDVPPLRPFRTFQALIPDIAELTDLDWISSSRWAGCRSRRPSAGRGPGPSGGSWRPSSAPLHGLRPGGVGAAGLSQSHWFPLATASTLGVRGALLGVYPVRLRQHGQTAWMRTALPGRSSQRTLSIRVRPPRSPPCRP